MGMTRGSRRILLAAARAFRGAGTTSGRLLTFDITHPIVVPAEAGIQGGRRASWAPGSPLSRGRRKKLRESSRMMGTTSARAGDCPPERDRLDRVEEEEECRLDSLRKR